MRGLSQCMVLLVLVCGLVGCSSSSEPRADGSVKAPQKTYKWKMVTTWPKNFPGLGTAPERFAKNVEAMSNGRLKVKVYGAGELVPAMEVFDSVMRGTAELGHGAGYYWKGKLPEAQFFTTVPFGFTAQEMNGWLHYGGGLELWREAYEKFGIEPLAAGNSGVQMGGWFNKEIKTMDDLKGLKMRIPGLGGEVFRRAGGLPVSLPGGELFTALQTGAIDATEWVGPYNDLAFGFHKAAKYYYYPGWHEPGATLELVVNKKKLAELPADLQAMVRVAARDANQDMLDEYTARNSAALDQLVNEHNVELRPFPAEVLTSLHALSETVVSEEAAKTELGKKIYESYKGFRDSIAKYHDITERAYINARHKD
ncbi:MAG: TRAP transporter substrate-binding protein [Myxococcota bacterium]|nr:TRAP transporter substrate-binding protein [Myxococcota bacterium]